MLVKIHFELENVKLVFKDEAVNEIAKKAIRKKTGARGLRSIIEALLLKTMFKLPTLEDVAEVIVDQSVVKNNTEPLIIHTKAQPRRRLINFPSPRPARNTVTKRNFASGALRRQIISLINYTHQLCPAWTGQNPNN